MNFVANIPYTKCWVRKEYLHDLERGHGEFVEAVIIAVKSVQGRALTVSYTHLRAHETS